MSAPIKIADLEQLDAAATPGPWVHLCMHDAQTDWPNGEWQRRVCRTSPMQGVYAPDEGHDRVVDNAALIARMRTALPALLRLARAANAVADNINPDVGCKKPCPDCEFHRALAAFDFGTEEPSA